MEKQQRVLTIVCIIVSVSFTGVLSCWGFILPYITSYLRLSDRSVTTNSMNNCYIQIYIVDVQILQIMAPVIEIFGLRLLFQLSVMLIGASYTSIGFISNYYIVMVAYFGVGVGFSFMCVAAVFLCMNILPENPGLSGLFASIGLSFSPFFTTLFIQTILNPNDLPPTIIVKDGEQTLKYFDAEVAGNVPIFFKTYGCLIFAIGVIFPLFITDQCGTKSQIQKKISSQIHSKDNSIDEKNQAEKEDNQNTSFDSNIKKLSYVVEQNNFSLDVSSLSNKDENSIIVNYNIPCMSCLSLSYLNLVANSSQLSAEISKSISKQSNDLELKLLNDTNNDVISHIDNESLDKKIKKITTSPKFFLHFYMNSLLLSMIFFLINYFTTFCQLFHRQETANSFSSFITLILIGSRILFGFVIDFMSVRTVNTLFLGSIQFSQLMLKYLISWVVFYLLAYVMIFSLSSGITIFFYTFCNKVYGNELAMHVFRRFGFAFVLSAFMIWIFDELFIWIGYDMTFTVMAFLVVFNMLLNFKFG